mmetsp:Transcript_39963/g.63972  ORF Transcript_39963/g.63972 Transcript_39963/m.63972 type:complete len:993 (+) Transcript_39963:182-3160(+)|eukprot:CAMPEP_0197072466 /NCGR_PEP_ID=MMETSP1384-20130603/210109_1 /TAXON_ID=29189 /ORGANISM="Ammonia sp." /LENGTH=992 /DNA_ID=CAMNT_0042511285 /DNA_START=166 /DNA_END=3144 /DNA_ORIENTATION=+
MRFLTLCSLAYTVFGRSQDTLSADDYAVDAALLPSACNDLEDGYHWIRPLVDANDEYPNIYVLCNNGYTILDPSLFDFFNYHHVKALFTSYSDVTDFVASSSLNDHVTWREWFLPADDDTTWAIAEDCHTCAEDEDFGANSVYYMTGNYNGCLWVTKGYCDMDPDSLECYECTAPYVDEPVSGLCTHMHADADHPVNSAHDDCVGTSYNAEPAIGTEGEFCVCYKPKMATMVKPSKWVVPDPDALVVQDKTTVVEVYNDDFKDGTYRILQPGIYKIMEDIEFDMNAGDYSNPNAEGMWYPREEQEREYMGSGGTFIGPYAMGFFAGFAIEADDVTVDLNGHTLKMSAVFHHQQRWFSVIEVGSKAFISGQGPANFGPYMTYANNVVIKNGIIGRSSHHGIHANGFENLHIHDVVVKDFEVAGMAMNGFIGLKLENCEIGPVYQEVPVMGVYTQARIMLPRLRKVAADNPYGQVTFNGRGSFTADEVLDELSAQMDIMFEHFINGKEWTEIDEDPNRIIAARKTFENTKGLPSSSTAYGIFLNSYGASVFAISGAPGTSDTAIIKNVHIHGLYKDPWEVPRIVLTKGPFNDIMDFTRVTNDGLETTNSVYIGSAYTDAQYAIHKLSEDWGVLGHSVVGTKVDSWISEGKTMGSAKVRCNGDIMLHVTKGVFGLRIDNVDNVQIDGLEIEDLQNIGELGSYVCGHYESTDDGGHRNQNYPLQRGYTGTEVHALSFVGATGKIDNLHIHNIISARGDAFAIQFFPSNQMELGTNIKIEDIHAGAHLPKNLLTALDDSMPNKIPRACAVDVWTWTDEDSEFYTNQISFVDKDSVWAKCLTTHTFCSNSEFDHEAVLTNIKPCDHTTIVKHQADETDENHLIYDKYIRHLSDAHQKLFAIMQDHKTPNFYPQRVYPNGKPWKQKKVLSVYTLMVMIASIILFALYKFSTYSKKKVSSDMSSTDGAQKAANCDDEYEPLIKSGPNSFDVNFGSTYQFE